MEITKNLQNTGALPTDIDTQTNTPENEIEIIEAESSDDENQINSPGRNYLTSGDEFSDFGSDDSIIDKDYYPSSSDSDENPHNLFDDTIEGSAAEADDLVSDTADENEANDTTDDEIGNMPHVGLDTNNWQDIVEGQLFPNQQHVKGFTLSENQLAQEEKKGRFVEDAIKTFGQLYPAVKQIRKSPK
ncbi:unnamed protein product [Acanthoscelides obtectus]|uniref:Uncharacterized protein n=1 Tax=Acanthoscelides obtectus TaxID=200917 RepID=A0A9P0LJD9_ACAOB|nr:unnamed protein product [Acanthoscelides obtectus]CAK1681199.1 hypothetical protein AOBTE_LOCUS33058 [Acanthoscelides obtectus]